jgi:hypothetical protein
MPGGGFTGGSCPFPVTLAPVYSTTLAAISARSALSLLRFQDGKTRVFLEEIDFDILIF